jgi:hypothetical protein
MPIDLRTRTGLTQPERWLVASDLHAILLDEIFIATRWTRSESVFHGGTALHLACESPRLSEDLDFMVVDRDLASLAAIAQRIVGRARLRILETLPGSTLELSTKDRGPGPDRLVTWDVRWKHPNRMGKVQVKLEFYAVRPEALADYRARPELRLPGLGRIKLTVEIPVPELGAFWGDKVKAFATRPEIKWRDLHDLGFISRQFERAGRPDDESLLASLLTSARIYQKGPSEILAQLDRRLSDGTFGREKDFIEDMGNWFAPETFASAVRNGTLPALLPLARFEVQTARSLLEVALEGGRP